MKQKRLLYYIYFAYDRKLVMELPPHEFPEINELIQLGFVKRQAFKLVGDLYIFDNANFPLTECGHEILKKTSLYYRFECFSSKVSILFNKKPLKFLIKFFYIIVFAVIFITVIILICKIIE